MTNYERQIDRMVDGELSSDAQRQLLLTCESDNRWRELALAYVESQAFGAALGVAPHVESGREDGLKQSPQLSQAPEETSGSPWNALSLAAAVLLSLGLGYGIGWWQVPGDSQDLGYVNVAGNQATPTVVEPTAGAQVADAARNSGNKLRTMPFTVSDPSSNELRQIDLPLVNASDLGPDWKSALRENSPLPDKLLRDLRENGLNVRSTRTMTHIRLPDGRLVVVPIDYFFEHPFQ